MTPHKTRQRWSTRGRGSIDFVTILIVILILLAIIYLWRRV